MPAAPTVPTSAAKSLLQKVALLATGNATNAGGLAYLESLVGAGNDYSALIDTVNSFMAHQAAMQGGAQVIQGMALNGLGLQLSLSEANELAQQIESGQQSWAGLFALCIEFTNDWGQTLNNRAEAAQGFLANLQAAQKSSFFDGAAVFSAVKTLLQGVGASAASAASAQGSLSALAINLKATGIQGVVVDGYLSGATVFMDSNGDGALSPGEWRTSTDASGNYLLPSNIGGSKLIALGGTDIMTGKPFQGVLTAPVGATVVTPLTTLAQALLDSGQASTAQAAASLVQQALGLPSIALLNYEPLSVLASSTASAADKAMALSVQKTAIQVANLIAQVGAAISAGSDVTPLGAGNAAIAALASAVAANQSVNLANSAAVLGIVLGAASNAGIPQNATNLALLARDVASLIAASNVAAANAQNITQLAQSAVVAQSSAIAAITSGVTAGSLGSAVNGFTGAALDVQIKQAQPGWINSEIPVPMPVPPAPEPPKPEPVPPVVEPPATGGGGSNPPPGPTLTVAVDPVTGKITFGGTATGDITFSVGADGLATFVRGGVTAGKTVDFSNASPAKSIVIGAGQTLFAAGADISGKAVSGSGAVNVVLQATTDLSQFASTLQVTAGVMTSMDISTNLTLSAVKAYAVFTDAGKGPSTLTLTAAQASGTVIRGNGNLTITGSDGAQTLDIQTYNTNSVASTTDITAGKGGDVIKVGGGQDTIHIHGPSTGVTESAVITFKALAAGDAITVAGLTLTATAAVAAADVAAGFADVTAGATTGKVVAGATWSGALLGFGTENASASGNAVVFTSTTDKANVADIALSSTSAGSTHQPVATTTEGVAAPSDSSTLPTVVHLQGVTGPNMSAPQVNQGPKAPQKGSNGTIGGLTTTEFQCQELLQGQTLSVLGLTLTVTVDMSANEVAAAFRGIAKDATSGQSTTQGTWSGKFTGLSTSSSTTGEQMTVQDADGDIVPTVTGLTENTVVTFSAMSAGQVISVGGLVLTASGDMTAAEVAAAFANLAVGSEGGQVAHGTWEGALGGFTSASATGSATVTFTSSTPNKDVTDLRVISGRTETATVTFKALATGESVTVGGLTLTVNDGANAFMVAGAFNNLSADAEGNSSASIDGTWSGKLTGFTSASDDPFGGDFWGGGPNHSPTVTFTSTTPQQNVDDLSVTGVSRTETANVQFKDLAAGDTITVAGLTLTATAAVAAADVAAGFAGLAVGVAAGNTVTGAAWSGQLADFATAGASAVGSKLVFTSSTADTDVTNIAISSTSSGGAVRPTAVITQGEGGASDSYAVDGDFTTMDAITGFNTTNDKLALPSGAGIVANGATWAFTGNNNLTITGASNGIVNFGGSAAMDASAWDLINAVLTAAGSQKLTAGVRHGLDTYVLQTDGQSDAQSSDIVVKLQGVAATDLSFITAPASSLTITKDTQDITAAFSGYTGSNASVDATGMSATQLQAVAGASHKVAENGITGTFTVNSDVVAADITILLGKTAAAAKVTVESTGMDAAALTAVGAAMAKVDKLMFNTTASSQVSALAADVSDHQLKVFGKSVVDSQLLLAGTAAVDTINLSGVDTTGAAVVVTGLGGADAIRLRHDGGTSNSFVLNYTSADDGGGTGDVVSVYNADSDSIRISGDLKAALGGISGEVVASTVGVSFTGASSAIGTVLKAVNLSLWGGQVAVSATNLADKGKVAALLYGVFGDLHGGGTPVANSKIFAVQASDFDQTGKFGVYVWTDTSTNPVVVDAAELKILGIFTGTFGAGEIVIA